MSLVYFFILFLGALIAFLILAYKGRLDMNEKPKHQMMDISEKQPPFKNKERI